MYFVVEKIIGYLVYETESLEDAREEQKFLGSKFIVTDEKGQEVSKLIGKEVVIKCGGHHCNGEWGIIKYFDGEYYHIAIANDNTMHLIFSRNEFVVRRNQTSRAV